jgi:hypothetical protein
MERETTKDPGFIKRLQRLPRTWSKHNTEATTIELE